MGVRFKMVIFSHFSSQGCVYERGGKRGGMKKECERGGTIPEHYFRHNISSYEAGKGAFEVKSAIFS